MAYTIGWFIRNRVVRFKIIGNMSIDELHDVSQKTIDLFEASDAPLVHLLVDESDLTHMPAQIKDLVNAAKCFNHPQMGWFITYGKNNQLLKFLAYIVAQVTQVRHRRFYTEKEALDFLYSVDVTLPKPGEFEEV